MLIGSAPMPRTDQRFCELREHEVVFLRSWAVIASVFLIWL
jgi:hypothetical protein